MGLGSAKCLTMVLLLLLPIISKTCPSLSLMSVMVRLLMVGPAFGRIRQDTASSKEVAGGTHELKQSQWQDSRMLRVKLSLTLEDLKSLIAAELNLMSTSCLDLMAKVLLRVLLSLEEPWLECMLQQIIPADHANAFSCHFPGTYPPHTLPSPSPGRVRGGYGEGDGRVWGGCGEGMGRIPVPNDTLPFVYGCLLVVHGDRTTTSTSVWLPNKGGGRSSQPPQAQTRAAKFSAAVTALRTMQKRLFWEVQKQRQLAREICRRRHR